MKICSVCRQSNILCNACAKAVEDGRIKQIDVSLSRAVARINKDKGYNIDFVDTVDDGSKLFVIVDSDVAGKFIGPGGRTIKEISKTVGRQIKLLEKTTGNEKQVMEKMIGTPVVGISKIFSTGGEALKVRVDRKYIRNVQPLTGVVGKILDKKVNFVFE